tara:strand:+ start:2264 stop:2524 length:261 start_codon:yes stop_codon:yes gene_type:complete
MNRFGGATDNLYSNNIKDDIPTNTKEILKKKETKDEKNDENQNNPILSNDLKKVLRKNRELYEYIKILESEKNELQKEIDKLKKNK